MPTAHARRSWWAQESSKTIKALLSSGCPGRDRRREFITSSSCCLPGKRSCTARAAGSKLLHTCTGLTLSLWSPTHAGHDLCFLAPPSVEALTGPCKEWSVLASARICMDSCSGRSAPGHDGGSPDDAPHENCELFMGLGPKQGKSSFTRDRKPSICVNICERELSVRYEDFSTVNDLGRCEQCTAVALLAPVV